MATLEILSYLDAVGPVLCLDIGSGTQDVLLARPGFEPENWPKFIIPAPARFIAQKIRNLREAKCSVWLYGHNMGGGFVKALKEHMKAGLGVAISTSAAHAIHDNIDFVKDMGIHICENAPDKYVPVYLSDFSPQYWEGFLSLAGLPMPNKVVIAAQDHGYSLGVNRQGRMEFLNELLKISTDPRQWIYKNAPPIMTRLASVQAVSGGYVTDTGTAAILGALCMPEVYERSFKEGITIINVGNGHIVAVLIYKGQACGIFEHHTGMRTLDELLSDLHEFRMGWLPDEQVRETGGHGTAFGLRPDDAGAFKPTFILGPKRQLLSGHGQFIAPYGDMMLAGCYGLLYGLANEFFKNN